MVSAGNQFIFDYRAKTASKCTGAELVLQLANAGLEALQLLTDLNISRNCIPSVSALVPLRHMRRLRTLDISHNEIGSHTVDPCRYLCPSLLSSNASALNQRLSYSSESWEIRSVFGSMQLVELSLAGNPAATIVGFRQALLECLPLLRVLDGVAVT